MHLKRLLVVASLIVASSSLSACAGTTESEDNSVERSTIATDPRDGWVLVDETDYDYLWKTCDGTTLVYKINIERGGGIAVVPDSPVCADRGTLNKEQP